MQKVLEDFLTPGGVAAGLGVVLSLIGGFVWATTRRKRIVALAAYHAFHIVEDIGNELEGDDGFDKTARYLKELDGWLLANGWRALKPGEQAVAKLEAQMLHGEQVARAKVATVLAEAVAANPQTPRSQP